MNYLLIATLDLGTPSNQIFEKCCCLGTIYIRTSHRWTPWRQHLTVLLREVSVDLFKIKRISLCTWLRLRPMTSSEKKECPLRGFICLSVDCNTSIVSLLSYFLFQDPLCVLALCSLPKREGRVDGINYIKMYS